MKFATDTYKNLPHLKHVAITPYKIQTFENDVNGAQVTMLNFRACLSVIDIVIEFAQEYHF